MIIFGGPLETQLYSRESIELPAIIRDRLPRIRSIHQPQNSDEIQELFSYCQKNRLSLIPRGAATSGIGCLIALKKSILVDLTNLNKILDLDERTKTLRVEAGVRWWEVQHFLKAHNLALYTCPSSLFSTVGGWLATGGYGINSYRYGHVSNAVDSLQIAAPRRTAWLYPTSPEFKHFLGTEGQMGIIVQVKLRVREACPSKTYLALFDTVVEAMEFVSRALRSLRPSPVHVSFFDRNRLAHKNLWLDSKVRFPRSEAVLLSFETPPPEDELSSRIEKANGTMAGKHLAAFLWHERFFPFSIRHFAPAVLGCEVILPLSNIPAHLARTRKFGEDYGLSLSTEASLIDSNKAVVFSIFPSNPRNLSHYFHLFLTYSLAHLALRSGGKPYGIGTWNLPLIRDLFSKEELKERRIYKRDTDPARLLNPGKSFLSVWPWTGLLRTAFETSGLVAHGLPFLKPWLRVPKVGSRNGHRRLPEAESCANCGACVVVCPAYLKMGTELVTAKGKLLLIRRLLRGDSISRSTAENVFYCLHCRLCEHVCQSKLSLIPVWEKLESIIEKRYGRPAEKIKAFMEEVETDSAYTRLLDTFGLAPQNGHQGMPYV